MNLPINKRKPLTLSEKLKIIGLIENGAKQNEVAKNLALSKTTINTIWLKRETIKRNACEFNSSFKKVRLSDYPSIDSALHEWFILQRSRNLPLNGPLLITKAQQISQFQNVTGFQASIGWLDNWKNRYGVIFKKASGEGASVDETTTVDWVNNVWPCLKDGFQSKDIFNADETALFYRLLPDKTMEFKGKECHGGKESKERLTILLCANATGSEKLKPLVIGKSQRPRCFKNIRDLTSLPVTYCANKCAWMTSSVRFNHNFSIVTLYIIQIFSSWLLDMNNKMRISSRKILLILDNCPPHVAADLNLSNIKVVFLPPNVTSKLQPLDRGVILSFKIKYRKLILSKTITLMDDSNDKPTIDILEAVYSISSAWNSVSSSCISNCFVNSSLIVSHDVTPEEPIQHLILPFPSLIFEDYVHVDDNVAVCDEPSIQTIAENHVKRDTNENIDEDDAECNMDECVSSISSANALKMIQSLKLYVTCHSEGESILDLEKVERRILSKAAERMKQSSIKDFFKCD